MSTAAYLALLAAQSPRFVVLAEVQPMERLAGWTAAGGGLTNTWYASFPTYVQTTVTPGGLYRRLDEVRESATALTSRASAALVDANLGSYFHDTTNQRIYVSTSTGANPEGFALVGAWFTLFFATDSFDFTDRQPYLPLITGTLPSFSAERPDPLFGGVISDTGSLTLLNTDGVFDKLSKQWVWSNKKVTFKLGGNYTQGTSVTSLAYADFETIGTMRSVGIGVDDEVAVLTLENIGAILNQSLPTATWADLSPTSVGAEFINLRRPLLFGAVSDCPTVYHTESDYYRVLHQTDQITSLRWNAVYAIHRGSGARTTLSGGRAWLGDAVGPDYDIGPGSGDAGDGLIQIVNATYADETYEIRVDAQISTLAGGTFGSFAQNLLLKCGEKLANIDTAAFTAADTAAPQALGLFLTEMTSAAEIMRTLEQSVNGQVCVGIDGRWTCRVFDPSTPADWTLSDADFEVWEPDDSLKTTLNETRVQYARNPSTGVWTEASRSDSSILYSKETSDSHTVPTYLTSSWDASAQANHLQFFKAVPTMAYAFVERGLTLMAAQVGDLVAVTRSRAPVARTGRFDGQFLILTKIEKILGPVPMVRGVLNDMEGQADRIARCHSSTTLTWATSTDAEKAVYGYCADTNSYIDATDPLTRALKVAY